MRHNATVPYISQLPAEILAEIFLYFEHQSRNYRSSFPFHWLLITFVCHRWRSVAQALPHLWSYVPMSNRKELVAVFLRLSKEVPLSIVPGTWTQYLRLQCDSYETLALLSPEAPRIRSLRLCLHTDLLRELISATVWDAPLLDSIDLELERSSTAPDGCLAFLQSAPLPALHSLRLAYFPGTFVRDFLRPTLTHLKISDPSLKLSVAEWLDALRALPLLEDLETMSSIDNGSYVTATTTSVKMCHLMHLMMIEDDPSPCTRLLDHLVLPQCHMFNLRAFGNRPVTAEKCRGVFAAAASALGDALMPRTCSLRLDRNAITVGLWQDVLPTSHNYYSWGRDASNDCELSEHLHVVIFISHCTNPDVLPILVSVLPLSHVRTLRFENMDLTRSIRPLSALQEVDTLLYDCNHPFGLLQVLSEPQNGAPVPFPALRQLTLRDATWRSRYPMPSRSSEWIDVEWISAILDARAKLGVPLDGLRLQGLRNVRRAEDLEWLESAPKRVRRFEWNAGR